MMCVVVSMIDHCVVAGWWLVVVGGDDCVDLVGGWLVAGRSLC